AGKPGPDTAPRLADAVLHVDLLLRVARPGEREAGEHALLLHAGELVGVKEVVVRALVAEKEPVAPGRPGGHALVQEGAERRDAGAGTDHDDRRRGIGRQAEGVRLLHIDLELVARPDALGAEGRGDAEPAAPLDVVA